MLDDKQFREAMGTFATGVTVVTASDGKGGLAGFTANAFTSLSLAPPQVLVCLSYGLRSYPVLRTAGSFAVHILAADQAAVARDFATRGVDKAKVTPWAHSARGNPVLERYLTLIECDLVREYDGSDHVIVIGQVRHLEVSRSADAPLLYYRGKLGGMAPDGGAIAP